MKITLFLSFDLTRARIRKKLPLNAMRFKEKNDIVGIPTSKSRFSENQIFIFFPPEFFKAAI